MGTRVVNAARDWIDTPYRHQASLRGVGADCLGLLRGVWRDLRGAEPETPPAYSPDWAEATGRETMAEAASRHLVAIGLAELQPGDVALFRMKRSGPARHCGIVATGPSGPTLIHAWSRHSVAEVPFDAGWQRRLAFAFRFPEI
ncbi:putative phage cell wall peptidase, NlpC/P60 family [Faunimonas pinastri]|uniref:Putative phage cell wall peptidase, NlpC/P60 family n=2 Tax=Faunimonas pinastri TaxID=1855383 RepID=A0A1H9QX71_9HYPH|nr:putative phage cell wall peptidase, NlpC/P60 family [Faunimonas pinastri]